MLFSPEMIPNWVYVVSVLVVLLIVLLVAGRAFVFIDNDSYGVVERRWSLRGGQGSGFMAMRGGPGFLPATIKGGWHRFMPFQYRVHRQKLITVRSIGYLFARTGAPLPKARPLPPGRATWIPAMRLRS